LLAFVGVLAAAATPCAVASDEPPCVYVAFEDRPGRDHDFNDVGLTMSAGETYSDDGALVRVSLAFELACLQGGDEHEVHVLRPFEAATRWRASVRRSRAASGAETPAGVREGRGDLDVVLFDTAHAERRDEVWVEVQLLESAEPRAAEPSVVQGRYECWLLDRTTGTEIRSDTRQPFGPDGVEVPCVLVLPDPGWQPPGEWGRVTDLYPDFERWFVAGDPACARWYEVAPR
jgi:hypothetical protein